MPFNIKTTGLTQPQTTVLSRIVTVRSQHLQFHRTAIKKSLMTTLLTKSSSWWKAIHISNLQQQLLFSATNFSTLYRLPNRGSKSLEDCMAQIISLRHKRPYLPTDTRASRESNRMPEERQCLCCKLNWCFAIFK